MSTTTTTMAGAGANSIAPPKGGRQAILGRLPPTDGKSQEEAAAVVGVGRKTIDDWERNTSIGETAITCTPLDLRIKVGKAEHYAKLFLLTSGRAGTGVPLCRLGIISPLTSGRPGVTVNHTQISRMVQKVDTDKMHQL